MNIIHLLYMDKNTGIKKIQELYNNLTYFDNYGNSVILFSILTILLFLTVSYCFIKTHIKPIKKNWVTERCKPYIIPFAGMINKPDNMSASDYTEENFIFCAQNILKDIAGFAVDPLTFIVSGLQAVETVITDDIQSMRAMFNNYRNNIQKTFADVLNVILNFISPLQVIIIKFQDIAARVQGVFFTVLYTFFGIFLTLESVLQMAINGISVFMVVLTILMTFAIAGITYSLVLAAIPPTAAIGLALLGPYIAEYLAVLGVYTGLMVPMVLTLEFTEGLGMYTFLDAPAAPPQAPSCFDKNTLIKMNDGSEKRIMDIQVGDTLVNNNMVTSKIKLFATQDQMYNLNGIIVSGTHSVKVKNNWMKIENHPTSIKIDNYNEPYIYCLNTEHKEIIINDNNFCDWDEIFEDDIESIKIMHKTNKYHTNNAGSSEFKYSDIHKYFDGGFIGDTKIKLMNGCEKRIKDIEINDILENGEKVYGFVEIDGKKVNEQYTYNLGKLNKEIIGGPNVNLCDRNIKFTTTINLDSKIKLPNKEDNLYHLLTDKKTFYINGLRFYDYNATIELILEKYRGKLLSMKYV